MLVWGLPQILMLMCLSYMIGALSSELVTDIYGDVSLMQQYYVINLSSWHTKINVPIQIVTFFGAIIWRCVQTGGKDWRYWVIIGMYCCGTPLFFTSVHPAEQLLVAGTAGDADLREAATKVKNGHLLMLALGLVAIPLVLSDAEQA